MFNSQPFLSPDWDWSIGADEYDIYASLQEDLNSCHSESPTTESFFSNPYNYELLEDMPF
jgi:hypothetical protein